MCFGERKKAASSWKGNHPGKRTWLKSRRTKGRWARKKGRDAGPELYLWSLLSADSDHLPHALWYTPVWNQAASAGLNLSACFLGQLWNLGPLPCDSQDFLKQRLGTWQVSRGSSFPSHWTQDTTKTISALYFCLKAKQKKKKSFFLHTSYYSVCASPTRLPQSSSVTLHWNRLYWLLWSIVLFSSPPSSSSSWCYIMSGCS